MSAGPAHLHLDQRSPLHRLRPQCKIAAAVLFVLAAVATPREAFWAFGVYAGVVIAVSRVGGIPGALLLRRLVIELPFVAFAFLLPFVAGGDQTEIGPVALSVDGLWGTWNILAKATIGTASAVVLTATTSTADMLRGLERLRLPRVLVTITVLMVRYGEVLVAESHRMRVARLSRGYDPRWAWQAKALAATVAALFIRSFERGERVHLAMVSRGFDGRLPVLADHRATRRQWSAVLTLPAAAAVLASLAWLLGP